MQALYNIPGILYYIVHSKCVPSFPCIVIVFFDTLLDQAVSRDLYLGRGQREAFSRQNTHRHSQIGYSVRQLTLCRGLLSVLNSPELLCTTCTLGPPNCTIYRNFSNRVFSGSDVCVRLQISRFERRIADVYLRSLPVQKCSKYSYRRGLIQCHDQL